MQAMSVAQKRDEIRHRLMADYGSRVHKYKLWIAETIGTEMSAGLFKREDEGVQKLVLEAQWKCAEATAALKYIDEVVDEYFPNGEGLAEFDIDSVESLHLVKWGPMYCLLDLKGKVDAITARMKNYHPSMAS